MRLEIFPLVESDVDIPRYFEKSLYKKDAKKQGVVDTPGYWIVPSRKGTQITEHFIDIGIAKTGNRLRGSVYTLIPKGYLKEKRTLRLKLVGKGHLSIRFMQSTVTKGGVAMIKDEGWKKADTVWEQEIFYLWDRGPREISLPLRYFYNKPFNVKLNAWLKGFYGKKLEDFTQMEIVVRHGRFHLYDAEFV